VWLVSIRLANRAAAAIVTACQFRASDLGGLSMSSDSSNQSSAESFACSGPYNFDTAATKDDNSRSAKCVCSSYIESEKELALCIWIPAGAAYNQLEQKPESGSIGQTYQMLGNVTACD
jgi:hypothetical protein